MQKFLLLCLLFAIVIPSAASASSMNGSVLSGSYAWSSNKGWINFGATEGRVSITDSGLTGYVWGQNIGWINLAPGQGGVVNDGNGNLSGYAWGEGVGWINFSGVTISSAGRFSGSASGDAIGTLTFRCASCSVLTDYRPSDARNASTGGGGGVGSGGGGGSAAPVVTSPQIAQYGVILPTPESPPIVSSPSSPTTTAPPSSPVPPSAPVLLPSYVFLRTLSINMSGKDVFELQTFLNAHGFIVATKGAGSPGHETQYFGLATRAALVRFQRANIKKIFSDGKLSRANGVFGSETYAFVNSLLRTEANTKPAPVPKSVPSVYVFSRVLSYGVSGKDVFELQTFLNAHGFIVAIKGAGSPGHETQYFGPALKAALLKFQQANAAKMFADGNVSNANGVFGPSTRAFVNAQVKAEGKK